MSCHFAGIAQSYILGNCVTATLAVPPASAITLLGWLMTMVGVYRIIAPQFASFVGTSVVAHSGFFIGTGIVLLALGGFLTFKGYAT